MMMSPLSFASMPENSLAIKQISNELAEELIEWAFQGELKAVVRAIQNDVDLIVSGVTGSGRTTLVKGAADKANVDVMEVDCLRVSDPDFFLDLFFASFKSTYPNYSDEEKLCAFRNHQSTLKILCKDGVEYKNCLKEALDSLIDLIGKASDEKNKRVVVFFKNVSHLQSFTQIKERSEVKIKDDKNIIFDSEKLRFIFDIQKKIRNHEKVGFIIIFTIGEIECISPKENVVKRENLEYVKLNPIEDNLLRYQITRVFKKRNLIFSLNDDSLEKLLGIIQGHFGDYLVLCRQLINLHNPVYIHDQNIDLRMQKIITAKDVEKAVKNVLEDLNVIFEMMILLLPKAQAHLLECLAVDPTQKPQSKMYRNVHGLSKGGTLQRALAGLKIKGLIYIPDDKDKVYRVTPPLLSAWIKARQYKPGYGPDGCP